MSGYILCQIKKADMPYFIENISTNIYTMEELCFYLRHNIYLLDETIIGEPLCDWIRDELELEKLYHRLYRILENEDGVGSFILPVFKEINYLSHAEFKEMNQELLVIEGQPPVVRQKRKGDYLVENQMYVNAIKVYEKALPLVAGSHLGEQFVGEIYHNMGCAYASLFQMKEACNCFGKANECMHTKASIKHYLVAFYLEHSKEEWEFTCSKLKVSDAAKRDILEEIRLKTEKISISSYKDEDMDATLKRLTKEYHRSTGY